MKQVIPENSKIIWCRPMKIIKLFLVCAIFSSELSLSQENFWQQTAGPTGGNIRTIKQNLDGQIFVGTGDHLYGGGSVFRSLNHGDNWTQLTFKMPNACFEEIAINSKGHIFAGTFPNGIYRSMDNGENWEEINSGLSYRAILSLAVDSFDVLYAGTNGGLFRSLDNGENWVQIGFFNQVTALTIDKAGNLFAGSVGGGIYLSRNNGINWTSVNDGLFNLYVKVLAIDLSDNVYAGTNSGGLYRFINNKNVWTQINENVTNHDVLSFAFNSKGYLFFGTGGDGIYCSKDQGESWINIGLGQVHSLFIDSHDYIFAGSRTEGIFRSHTDSVKWLQKNLGLINTYVTEIVASTDNLIFAGTEHNGMFQFSDNGQNWLKINNGLDKLGIHSLTVTAGGYLFAGTDGAIYRSCDNGQCWEKKYDTYYNVNTMIATPAGHVFASIVGDWNTYMIRSTDNGETWEWILNKYTNSFAFNSQGYIFASSYGGVLFSRDNGSSWQTPDSILTDIFLKAIVIDGDDRIIAVSEKGEIFRSTNDGATWTKTASNLPESFNYKLISNLEGKIFAGTDVGIFHSSDKGDNWIELSKGLPNAAIISLALNSEGFLFAGTQGHGVFKSISKVSSVNDKPHRRQKGCALVHNYPNPFNAFTTFKIVVPQLDYVSLKIFNILGRETAELVTQKLDAGSYTIIWDARGFPSGLYYYRYQTEELFKTGNLILVK